MTARNTDTGPATAAWTDMGLAMTEDIAMLWRSEWRPGQYYPVLESVAARTGRSTRTIERHLSRARLWGLL